MSSRFIGFDTPQYMFTISQDHCDFKYIGILIFAISPLCVSLVLLTHHADFWDGVEAGDGQIKTHIQWIT